MSVHICPRCQARYVRQPNSGDFVHDCSVGKSEALQNEDVVVVGSWEDYTGSATIPANNVMMQGAGNKFQGTRAGVDGYEFVKFTSRGNNSATTRSRTHLEYVEHGE